MACHKPCVFKLWKNKRECLYSVKSSIGTEATESKLAHSRSNQFGKALRMKFCWMKQRTGTACQQFHNCRYVEMASHLYITDEGKRLRWCQTFQHPWHPLAEKFNIENPKAGSYMLFGTECDSHTTARRPVLETFWICGERRNYTTVPKYTSTRSVYPLHGLVPRYDVHEKQLTSTLKAKGFVMYSWSEIPRLWISNPSNREYLPDCVHRSQDCGSRTLQRNIIKLAKVSGVYDPKTVDHNGSTQIRYTKFSSSHIEETHAQRHFGYGVKRIFISFFLQQEATSCTRRCPSTPQIGASTHCTT